LLAGSQFKSITRRLDPKFRKRNAPGFLTLIDY
jgi:hypothetical protein